MFVLFETIDFSTFILAAGALKRTSTSTADLIEPKKMKLGDLEGKKEEDESMVKMDSKKPRDINKDIKNTLKTFTREVCSKFFTRLGNMRFL